MEKDLEKKNTKAEDANADKAKKAEAPEKSDVAIRKAKVKRKKRQNKILLTAVGITLAVIVLLLGSSLLVVKSGIIKNNGVPVKSLTQMVDLLFGQSYSDVDHTPNFNLDTDNGDAGSFTVPMEGEEIYNFLVVGHDKAASLTDVSMIVNFNISTGSVTVMQVPRDTYVNYDNYWYHKVNGVYNYYKSKDAENPELEGIKGYAAFLEQNLCIKIHYYAIMDLDQFVNIVDALGGVDIYIEQKMYYKDDNQGLLIDLQPGQQTLNGKQAEMFVRYRSGFAQGDIGRGQNQKEFMAALFNTFKNKMNLMNLAEICAIVNENLVTNLTTKNLVYFANHAKNVDMGNIVMLTLPGNNSPGSDGLSYYGLNKEGALEAVNKYFNIYEEEITAEIFDKNRVFDNGGYIYSAPKDKALNYEYDAGSIVDGTVDVPK